MKHYTSYLTVNETYNLKIACAPIHMLGYGTYHVGSSLVRKDYHDVDLRCIMPDDEYVKLPNVVFPEHRYQ